MLAGMNQSCGMRERTKPEVAGGKLPKEVALELGLKQMSSWRLEEGVRVEVKGRHAGCVEGQSSLGQNLGKQGILPEGLGLEGHLKC